jgi:protein TonB
VTDLVSRLIADRTQMDSGFRQSVVTSSALHVAVMVAAVVSSFLHRSPPLKVMDGFAVVLPRGGGGQPVPVEAPPAAEAPAPPPPSAPPPKVAKPPKEVPNPKRLPEPDAASRRRPDKPAKPAAAAPMPQTSTAAAPSPGGAAGAGGMGVGLVPGPGVPEGTDFSGDWYLAGVQRKIWNIWMAQIRPAMPQSAIVAFVIESDGSIADVKLVQSSGTSATDFAAQRAVYSAQPFGPLPKNYGTNRISIQAVFKSSS